MNAGAVIVTGAGGFVCSEVVLALHKAGCDVLAVDLIFDASTKTRLAGILQIEGQLADVLASGAIGPVRGVIHGAAITASPERLGISKATHIRRNMDLLTTTLDFAHGAGASWFLFISSMGVFGSNDAPLQKGCFTEATQPTATCTYCAAKHAGELLTTSAGQDGFATLSLRLGNIFGRHEALRETRQNLCLVSRMLAEAQSNGLITVQTPEAVREWSWLPDLALTIACLIQDFPITGPRVLHAGTPPTITDFDLARAIAARIHGVTIRLASPPFEPTRPPMGCGAASVFAGTNWTTMEAALDEMIQMAVPS